MSENDMDASIASAEPLNASGKHNSPDVTPLPLPLRRLRREVGNPLGPARRSQRVRVADPTFIDAEPEFGREPA